MIHPDASWRPFWNTLVVLGIIYTALEVPLHLALGYDIPRWLTVVDAAVLISFAIDMVLIFFTSVRMKGHVISDRRTVAQIYMRGWFIIDLLATLPLDLVFAGMLPVPPRALRVLRLLRLGRILRLASVTRMMASWQNGSQLFNPSIRRMGIFLFWVVLVAHWVACGWLLLGAVPSDLDQTTRYVHALYWCVTTLTTVGYGDITPSTNVQMVYTMVVQVLGVGVYGYVIGNIASLLANIDVARAAHLEKMERVNAFMKYRGIPTETQERIRNYFGYLWESRMGEDENVIIDALPPSLKTDVAMFMNRHIITRVPLFETATDACIRELVLALKPIVQTPGDIVMHHGDIGDSMYFVSKGSMRVMSADRATTYATLGPGDYFGEMALLLEQPRSATVQATTYCDLYVLKADVFHAVAQRFPEFAKHVHETTLERSKALEQSGRNPPAVT